MKQWRVEWLELARDRYGEEWKRRVLRPETEQQAYRDARALAALAADSERVRSVVLLDRDVGDWKEVPL